MARAMVSASTGAMNSVLAKLTRLLEEEHKLLKGLRRDMIFLKDELTSMQGFLEKMADVEDLDPLVKGWMKQVREMTYDLEGCIDDYLVQSSGGLGDAKKGFIRKAARLLKTSRARHQIASEIQELKVRFREASERRSRYMVNFDHPVGSPSKSSSLAPIDPRLPVLSTNVDSLVGIDGPREQLIEWLTPDGQQQQLKVVSVVGMGGVGKTTLALEVYRSLRQLFGCHAFVSLSQHPDLKMILRSILSQVSAQEYAFSECGEEQLIDELRELLMYKRYFVVIDDVWDEKSWQLVRLAFPINRCGSRILVTTRVRSIATSSCCSKEDHIFEMAPLGYTEARELFFSRIFHSECCPPHLEDISNEILKQCRGFPLAIITIASLLATKSATTEEWMRFRDSIGSELCTSEGVVRILNLSYIDLPFHLRTCLLYLSIFPEDYIIDRARLIRRWMAEGFIIEERGKSLEEVGECYFNELISRSFIQPASIQYDGRIKACQVHDIVLELIRCKSAEENFVTIYDDRVRTFGLQDRVRRLSLYCDPGHEDTFLVHVRSLTIFKSNKEMQMPTLANFRALRVLDLECSGELEENYLQNIGRLYLLRYLQLQTTSAIVLPAQIGELQYLETLDLTGAQISGLPRSIVRLKRLTYLLVNNVKLLDQIRELQALQELSHVEVDSNNSACSLEELGRLTMLRVLGLNWCISDTNTDMKIWADSLVSSLNKLGTSNLQSLHIGSTSGCSLDFLLDSLSAPFYHLREFRMTSEYYFPRIPKWMASLVNLTLLNINIAIVGEEVLQILGEMPSLLVLVLSAKSTAPEQGVTIRSSGFRCLRQFDFICWNSWAMLMFEAGTIWKLEKLHLKFVAKGAYVHTGFHFGIQHLASLKHLHIDIDCAGAETEEVAAAEAAIKSAVTTHPNRPRLELQRWREKDMVMDQIEITVHGEGEEGHNEEGDIDVLEEELNPTTES